MTEREKIIEVIKQASGQSHADFHELFREGVKRVRDGEISCFTNHDVRPTHDEILADALIAAGIGDTTNLIVENEVLQRALRNLAQLCAKGAKYYLQSDKAVKERERELYDEWINDAEKELQKERKDV